jgi:large repetitive protein
VAAKVVPITCVGSNFYSEECRFPMTRRVLVLMTAAAVALVFTTAAWALRFTDESYFPPVGSVGSPYSFTFGGAGGCGPALPYQYSVINGWLPPGLTLASSGHISGTPGQAGAWSFWVNLSDQNPPSADWCVPASAQREFTITIGGAGCGCAPPPPLPPAGAVSITTEATPAASVGSPYSLTLAASGSAAKSWSITAGSLPTGLSLAADGVLSGTPTAAGTVTFTVKVSAGGAASEKQFTLQVDAALTIGAPESQVAEVAVPLSIELGASGGSAPYRWEITQGSLPNHVGFIGDQGNGSTATIKGVPADAGSFPLTFTVTDVRGRTTVHAISLKVSDKLRLAAVKMPLAGHVGKLYRATGVAQGGFGARAWSVARGKLAPGLHLDPSTGTVSGRPTRQGRYEFYLAVKDELGAVRSMKLSIVIHT